MFDFLNEPFNTTASADFVAEEGLRPGVAYLSDLPPGTEFLIAGEVYILLENIGHDESRVIRKEPLRSSMEFGTSADWKSSPIRDYLNEEYYNRISCSVGAENILLMKRDLTSWDGLSDYGTCVDKISMLTSVEYAKYHNILGVRSSYSNWLWTITPYSTPSNGRTRFVCYIEVTGALDWHGCGNCGGVRPFLILKPSISVKTSTVSPK